jgi:hypothetical protein
VIKATEARKTILKEGKEGGKNDYRQEKPSLLYFSLYLVSLLIVTFHSAFFAFENFM